MDNLPIHGRSQLITPLFQVLSTLQIHPSGAYLSDESHNKPSSMCDGPSLVSQFEENDLAAIGSTMISKYETIVGLTGTEADACMWFLQELIDRSILPRADGIGLLLDLAIKSNIIPSFLEVQGVHNRSDFPLFAGGFGDVWRANLGDKVVALKTPRVGALGAAKIHKNLCREVLLWRQLRHRHLLEFIGIFKTPTFPAIVSPWMENGNILSFLDNRPTLNRRTLLMQIADALDYLHHHDPPIVHQDIRCANILVNNNKEAVLADFGLSRLDRDMFNNFASTVDDGCLRWRAPELMFPEDGIPKPSPASDMWAFGMLVLEMFTHSKPFADTAMDPAVVIDIFYHRLPRRPGEDEVKGIGFTDRMWGLVQKCWTKEPLERLSSREAMVQLQALNDYTEINNSLDTPDHEPLVAPLTPPMTLSPSAWVRERCSFLETVSSTSELAATEHSSILRRSRSLSRHRDQQPSIRHNELLERRSRSEPPNFRRHRVDWFSEEHRRMDTVVSPTELSLSSVSLASSACSSGSARVKRRSGAGFCAWKWPFTIASGVINILGGCTGYFSPRRAYTIHTVDSLLSTKSRSEMGGMLWDSGIGDGNWYTMGWNARAGELPPRVEDFMEIIGSSPPNIDEFERVHGVHVRIERHDDDTTEVTISGFYTSVERARKEIVKLGEFRHRFGSQFIPTPRHDQPQPIESMKY